MLRLRKKRFLCNIIGSGTRNSVLIKGPTGCLTLNMQIPGLITGLYQNYIFSTKQFIRSLYTGVVNLFIGNRYGYFSQIRTEGVGFRFRRSLVAPQVIGMTLGQSHFTSLFLPLNILFRCHKNHLILYSNNNTKLNNLALNVKKLRFADAYKGKGLKFAKEVLKFKPGKLRQR